VDSGQLTVDSYINGELRVENGELRLIC
jgi:hypothetical protein